MSTQQRGKSFTTVCFVCVSPIAVWPRHQLGTDTWYYVKRAVLAVIESLAKHMMVYKDSFVNEILAFLDACEENGKAALSH